MRTSTVSQSHYRSIVDSSEDVIISWNLETTLLTWNPAAERLYGYAADEVIGEPLSILIPPERAGEERRILDRVLRGEPFEHFETERVRKDGARVAVELTVSPIREPTGRLVGASVIARDITDRLRALSRAERLQEVTVKLAREIQPGRTVDVLLDNALPALGADAAAVGLIDHGSGQLELAGSAGYSDAIDRFRRMPLDADLPITEVVRTGEPLWLEGGDELRRRYPVLPGARSQFASLAIVPLALGSVPFGAIVLSFREPHEFPPVERAFMFAITAQAARALERGRLFAGERRRREQLAFIAEANALLTSSLEVDATLRRLAALAVPRIGDWCIVDLASDDGGIRTVAVAHADRDDAELADELRGRHPLDPDLRSGAPNVIRSGEPELYPAIADEARAGDDDHLRLLRKLDASSAIVVPLTARGRTFGAMTVVSAESGHRYGDDDLGLAAELARHAGLAVDNATLYRREHDAAVTLQRALLPERLPVTEGAQVAARYLPAGPGLEVGGDWYDMVETDDGELALVVGDVAGRGLGAAAIMGRLRTALRAYVLDGYRPAAAVERLDTLMSELEEASMATLVHLSLDLERGRVEYVRAGHPPLLLRDRDGRVRELADAGSPPIGIGSRVPFRSASIELDPDSTLVLYTDGLVEGRAEGLGPGVAKLRETLAAAPLDAEDCVEAIVAELGATELGDDAAVVALRFLDGK
jgi:PAS domain S-box-containing protein